MDWRFTTMNLHELVRQYAAAKLAAEAPQVQAAHERHSLFYLGLLEANENRLKSHHQKETLAELTGEMDNIRAAWGWATANRRLAGEEDFTVAPSRYLGHYVAGTLAERVGCKVELTRAGQSGITATVSLPRTLLLEGDEVEAIPERRSTVDLTEV